MVKILTKRIFSLRDGLSELCVQVLKKTYNLGDNLIHTRSRLAKWFFLIATTIWIAVFCVLIYNEKPIAQIAGGLDTTSFLDGAWRIYCGQAPNADFKSGLGMFSFFLGAVAMHLTGPTAASIECASILMTVPFSIWTWLICQRRLSPFISAVVTIFIAGIFLGMHPVGDSCLHTN